MTLLLKTVNSKRTFKDELDDAQVRLVEVMGERAHRFRVRVRTRRNGHGEFVRLFHAERKSPDHR